MQVSSERLVPTARARRGSSAQRLLVLMLGAAIVVTCCSLAAAAHGASPRFQHVIVVMLENRSYGNVVGSASAPYINGTLMKQNAYGTNLYVTTHNSPAAYYMVSAGKSYEKGDGGYWAGSCSTATTTCSTSDPSIFTQLHAAGKTWRVYSEDQSTNCQLTIAKKYWPNHNPAIFFRALGPNGYTGSGDGTCRNWDVPATHLATDIASGALPAITYLIPNDCDNMHDSCYPTYNPVKQGDTWLQHMFAGDTIVRGGLAAWAQSHDTLVLITFDESIPTDTQYCCPYRSSGGGGHVGLWVIGPRTKVRQGGYRWTGYANLYWLFKTIEENWSFTRLGHSADSGVADLAPLFISQ
jgi:phospholipase C